MSILQKLKANRALFGVVIAGVVLIIALGIMIAERQVEKSALETEHADALNQLSEIERKIGEKQADIDSKKLTSIRQTTGLDPKLIVSDSGEAEKYFKQAFSWKNGDEYEKARQQYIKSLGEDNTFTKVYLPPDVKIDTNDGKLSYIDFKKIRATMDGVHIIPMTSEGNRIRYVAFVTYYMHKNENDLVNKNALNPSLAIIEFTASGDKSTGGRVISDVNGRAGFSSSSDGRY